VSVFGLSSDFGALGESSGDMSIGIGCHPIELPLPVFTPTSSQVWPVHLFNKIAPSGPEALLFG
jgi:hypothetical protein